MASLESKTLHRVALLLGLVGAGGCDLFDRDEVAFVRAVEGAVSFRPGGGDDAKDAPVGTGLAEGDIISTGAASRATLDFKGNNQIELSENTTLVIKRTGGTAMEIGAVLMEGSAQVSSRGGGTTLAIGTPFGVTEVGVGEVIMEIRAGQGITVSVGEIFVEAPDGKEIRLQAGDSLTLDGLVVPLGGPPPEAPPTEGLTMAPMTVTLLANTKQVQIKRKDEDTWRAPKKRDQLAAGDAIRTRGATSTSVQVGESAALDMGPGTELSLGEVAGSSEKVAGNYTLLSGTTRVRLQNRGKKDEHVVEAGDARLKVRPGRQEADVDIATDPKGRTRVDVRFGTVELPDGTIVEAGSSANLKGGELEGEVRPLAASNVVLRPKTSSIVHYLGDVPSFAFMWPAANGNGTKVIEVSRDKDFKKPMLSEELHGSSFVYDRLPAGRYYWRVGDGKTWDKGLVVVQKHVETDCANCKRNVQIKDDGERAVVHYQQKLPAFTLNWAPVKGAVTYEVKVFADGSFDTPLTAATTDKLEMPIKAGRLQEGQYYWLVRALDAGGGEVATGRMNVLKIEYDNAITDLRINAPRHGQRVTSSSIVAQGEIQLGARLSINGKSVGIDEQGRFRSSVGLERGNNRIVFRSLPSDGIERFYVRDVFRR